MQTNEVEPIPYTKTNLKWINQKCLYVKPIKFIDENIAEKLHDTEFVNELLDLTPKKA